MTSKVPGQTAVAVVGATGVVGRQVAATLTARGFRVRLVGRDPAGLEQVAGATHGDIRPIRTWTSGELAEAMRGCVVVCACVGPFARLGEATLQAALAAGVHYCDCAAEQDWLRRVHALDGRVGEASITLVPGLGLGAVGDILAADLVAEMDTVDRMSCAYALEAAAFSPGTRETSEVGQSETWQFIDGAYGSEPPATESTTLSTPWGELVAHSFAYGSAMTVSRRGHVSTVRDYIAPPGSMVEWSESARALRHVCEVAAQSPSGVRRTRRAVGSDAYGMTAEMVTVTAEQLALRRGGPGVSVITPAEAIDGPRFLEATGHAITEATGSGGSR